MHPCFTVTVAGRRLAVSGDSGLAAVAPGFAGVVDPDGGAAHATLRIETGADPADQQPWRQFENGSHHDYRGGTLAVIERAPSSVETYEPGAVPRLTLAASPAALTSGDLRSQPVNHAIASWLASPTVQMIHAGAVAFDGCGVLLVGAGGRGKSTTALACAREGFSFLGDDLCVVEVGSANGGLNAHLHGLYATAKLNRDSRKSLGACHWPTLGVTRQGKDAVALPSDMRFDRVVPLVAVVGIRQTGESAGAARRLSPGQAVRLLAATGGPAIVASGKPHLWLHAAAAIAREVPTYDMALSWDLEGVVAGMRAIVECSRR